MDNKKIESSEEDIKILCSACGKEFQGVDGFLNPLKILNPPTTACSHCGYQHQHKFSWLTWITGIIFIIFCLTILELEKKFD